MDWVSWRRSSSFPLFGFVGSNHAYGDAFPTVVARVILGLHVFGLGLIVCLRSLCRLQTPDPSPDPIFAIFLDGKECYPTCILP